MPQFPGALGFASTYDCLATLDPMRQKLLATLVPLLLPAILSAGASLRLARDLLSSERPQASQASTARSDATSADSHSGAEEGCKLHPYTGPTALDQLPNYFKGEEDLRTGMTCQFRIHPDLPVFTFQFPGKPDNTFGDIEISNATTGEEIETVESSTDPGLIAPVAAKDLLTVVDANFDGYKDLQILNQCGGTGNCSYDFYLYDPKVGQFVQNRFLSDLATPSFDAAKKQVTTSSNSSASDWENETYQYKDGQYTLIHRVVSEWDRAKKSVTVSTYEFRNGTMQLVSSESTPE
jgi:hypothetical protein